MAETVADIPALAALWDPEKNEEPATFSGTLRRIHLAA